MIKVTAGKMRASERAAEAIEGSVDFKRRRIYLHGEIETATATKLITNLHILDETDASIRVHMFSVGGDVAAGLAIYDALRCAKSRVIIEAGGEVASMATIVLQAGDERVLYPETRVMIHNVYVEMNGLQRMDSSYFAVYAREICELSRRYYRILAEHTGQSERRLRSMCQRETYLSAQEALALGFADSIVAPKPLARHDAQRRRRK